MLPSSLVFVWNPTALAAARAWRANSSYGRSPWSAEVVSRSTLLRLPKRSSIMLSSWFASRGRRVLILAGILVSLAGVGLLVGRSVAQVDSGAPIIIDAPDPSILDVSNLVRVEEDWSLLLTTPDFDIA